jgi:arylsulfatase
VTTEQKTSWPEQRRARAGAPNVMIFLTDDVGFGACSTFGGPVPTPVLDRLAERGVRFTRFHTTGMCSPTRASLLTGRNPHRVNMGIVANRPTGYDGYTTVLPKSAGTMAQILRAGGYSTGMFGKSHLTPEWEMSAAGPFDRWPTGLGFDYFYGFLGFDANMWAPALVENTKFIRPPSDDVSYHLERDLADQAIRWIHEQRALNPNRPFFAYYCTGAAHSPHHAPREWIDRFAHQFDHGWDSVRQETFDRQKALGIVLPTAKQTSRPEPLQAWESLSPQRKRLGARLMESYAANLAFADHQIGRVIDELERLGELDNTLVIFIQGDNGGSAEGGFDGLLYEQSLFNRFEEDLDFFLDHLDDIGGPNAYNHYPAAWAWALNSPFQYFKQVASHFGATRNGMVMSWPRGMPTDGSVRTQFHHVSDILPTVLEAAGVTASASIDGLAQDPLDGVSLLYAAKDAAAPPRRTRQIFECLENFGIYDNGWMACTTPKDLPWQSLSTRVATDPKNRTWELYRIDEDFSQAEDCAESNPSKLKAMEELFWAEAGPEKILPIHPPTQGREGMPSLGAEREVFVYRAPATDIPADAAAHTIARSFAITAEFLVPTEGVRGVLVSHGGRFGGYALYVDEGMPVFHYNALAEHQFTVRGQRFLQPGLRRVSIEFEIDHRAPGAGGEVRLDVDGEPVGRGRIGRTLRTFMNSESFSVGRGALTPVSEDYAIRESQFTGELKKVLVMLR